MKKLIAAVMLIAAVSFTYAEAAESPFTGCTSYDQCVANGMQERSAGVNSVLIYYVGTSDDIKYSLFNNLSIRVSGNLCPPNLSVFKKVNNINYLMNTYKMSSGSQCTSYFANVTGEGRNRDSVVGQLEIYFCNASYSSDNCNQAVIYSKLNLYDKSTVTNKISSDQNQDNMGQNNNQSNNNQSNNSQNNNNQNSNGSGDANADNSPTYGSDLNQQNFNSSMGPQQ